MLKELDVVAKTEKASKSDIVKEAIAHYLAVKRFKQLRKQVLPFAKAEGVLRDEDIINNRRR